MESDSEDKDQRYANIPIPSYDEATASSPPPPPPPPPPPTTTPTTTVRGAREVSDDAERQGLLGQQSTYTYRPPTVTSPRGSEDEHEHEHEHEHRRNWNVEELDYLDPNAPDSDHLYHHHRPRIRRIKFISTLGATLSSIRLPSFRLRTLYPPMTVPNIPTIPEQYRMGLPTAARLCALFTIVILIYTLFIFDIFPGGGGGGGGRYLGRAFNPEAVRMFVQDNVDPRSIEDYLHHITAYDHVAGTKGDLYLAEWMREKWIAEGYLDRVELNSYYVYLNYPTPEGREVSIVSPDEKRWRASLEEETVDAGTVQTLAWHGHSKNGDVTGPLIFANEGSPEDFEWLNLQDVVLNGSIALMRYGGTQGDLAWKIKAAQDAGCVGALIYSDPSDDGSGRGAVWPDGPWRPDDSVQRGGVGLTSWIVGDPLTPGYASTKDAPTLGKDDNPGLVQIPSLPLAWRDAKVLLQSIQDIGVPVPESWISGDVDFPRGWHSGGHGQNAVHVRVKNLNDENDKQRIWNLHGIMEGVEQPQKKIIIGNHRDAWCFGSSDPGSGSAVMMELVRIFGQLAYNKWRPLRTIEFVSWDAGEYNLIGSTEYVEDHIAQLRAHGVAYINVDVGIGGIGQQQEEEEEEDLLKFRARGSPMWNRALMHVLDRVDAPTNGRNNNTSSSSLKDVWDSSPDNSQMDALLDARSDYVAFQDLAGISCIDFGFMKGGKKEGEGDGEEGYLPRDSCYENFEWMKKFGDPGFSWHRALAQVWALLILEVADRPILPFDLVGFGERIRGGYIDDLEAYAEGVWKMEQEREQERERSDGGGGGGGEKKMKRGKNREESEEEGSSSFDETSALLSPLNLAPLRDAAEFLQSRIETLVHFETIWTTNVLTSSSQGVGGGVESLNFAKHRIKYNNLLAGFERDLLDLLLPSSSRGGEEEEEEEEKGKEEEGKRRGREQFKHVIYGSQGVLWPMVREAIDRGDWEGAREWVERIEGILRRAGGKLVLS